MKLLLIGVAIGLVIGYPLGFFGWFARMSLPPKVWRSEDRVFRDSMYDGTEDGEPVTKERLLRAIAALERWANHR